MNTQHPPREQPDSPSSAAAVDAMNEALRRFVAMPSVSNKVAAVVAMQAYFEAVERSAVQNDRRIPDSVTVTARF